MDQVYLDKIQVKNFRNLQADNILNFSSGVNCIFGLNGNGKTNILEAVYYLLNRKSFRKNTSFQQMINVECEQPEIIFSSTFKDYDQNLFSYTGQIDSTNNSWYLNNSIEKKKLGLNCIFINPFDSFSFHGLSSFRRNWVDTHLSILSPQYKKTLSKFNAALRFRNTLLSKKPLHFVKQISANDSQLSDYSFDLLQERKQFLSELKDYCALTFKIIFEELHRLEIELESRFYHSTRKEILDYYQQSLEKDAMIGHTRVGVHRDDYIFKFNGFNSYEYCSLGQQKMSFLSLLFAYIELFRYKFSSYPIVLIDDVSGELDERRWKNLIGYLQAKKFQVLITTANENFKKELEKIEDARKFNIDNGRLVP